MSLVERSTRPLFSCSASKHLFVVDICECVSCGVTSKRHTHSRSNVYLHSIALEWGIKGEPWMTTWDILGVLVGGCWVTAMSGCTPLIPIWILTRPLLIDRLLWAGFAVIRWLIVDWLMLEIVPGRYRVTAARGFVAGTRLTGILVWPSDRVTSSSGRDPWVSYFVRNGLKQLASIWNFGHEWERIWWFVHRLRDVWLLVAKQLHFHSVSLVDDGILSLWNAISVNVLFPRIAWYCWSSFR